MWSVCLSVCVRERVVSECVCAGEWVSEWIIQPKQRTTAHSVFLGHGVSKIKCTKKDGGRGVVERTTVCNVRKLPQCCGADKGMTHGGQEEG